MYQRRNQKEDLKNLEISEKGNTISQNIWDAATAVLEGMFTEIMGYIKKKGRFR